MNPATESELPPLPPRIVRDELGPAREARPLEQLTIAWTGEVRGEIEPCGCPTVPYGGFVRRERYLDQLRQEDVPLFVLDAGEMLIKGPDTPDPGERARVVLRMARTVGLDAWAPAPLDLYAGPVTDDRALSATWDGLPGARVIERDGVRLGVVGLSARPAGDPVERVKAAIAGAGEADLWVALSNAPPAIATQVAEQVPGLGAVLSLRNGEKDEPGTTAGAPIVETPDRGRFVTVVRVFVASVPGPWSVVEKGPAVQVSRLTEEAARAASAETRQATRKRLTSAREELGAAIAGRTLAVVEDRPLGSDLDGDAKVHEHLAGFQAESVDLAQARVEAAGPRWGTSGRCSTCHTDRLAWWAAYPHAKAYEALVARGSHQDPECIGCHSTAWGRPGGNASMKPEAIQAWKDVQCEACHGPMGGHPDDGKPSAPVTPATCTGCHDAANSPEFDYAKYLSRISCVLMAKP